MASVYLGRTRGPGGFERLVALKVMHDHISHDPAFSAMFLDEARLAARIRHPNVVPTLDVAEDGRYIVMEYVEGASLHAILSRLRKQGERIPLPVALRIFVDALSGLHAAHELADAGGKPLHIVHRDVSPHNILVGVDGTSRITDFGIAHAEARITSTRGGELKGKLPYMAPEQLEDDSLDRRTDVYAAGCVLWEILVGERLFKAGSEAAIACAILAGPERSAKQAGADVPDDLDAACMQALGPRDRRFLTALAFSEAVERAAEASGIKIARHRDVGRFAQKTAVTFPAPASIISRGGAPADAGPDEEPRGAPIPPTVPAKRAAERAPATASPPSTPPPSTPTVTKAPSTADASTFPGGGAGPVADDAPITEVVPTVRAATSDDARHDTTLVTPASPPDGARTTAQDRPPPEVAAVIRAEYERVQQAPPAEAVEDAVEDAPNTAALLATSLGRPRATTTSRLAVAVVAAIAIAAGLWFAVSTGDPEPSAATASASATPSSAEAPGSVRTGSEPTAPPEPTAAPAEGQERGSPGVAGPKEPAPVRAAPPVPTTAAPPRPAAPPTPPPPKIQPRPAPTGYHPAAP